MVRLVGYIYRAVLGSLLPSPSTISLTDLMRNTQKEQRMSAMQRKLNEEANQKIANDTPVQTTLKMAGGKIGFGSLNTQPPMIGFGNADPNIRDDSQKTLSE